MSRSPWIRPDPPPSVDPLQALGERLARPVRAEVVVLDAFSAHADADELVGWATSAAAPETCYVVHGGQRAAETLARRLRQDAGWTAVVPRPAEVVLI